MFDFHNPLSKCLPDVSDLLYSYHNEIRIVDRQLIKANLLKKKVLERLKVPLEVIIWVEIIRVVAQILPQFKQDL